MSWMSLPARRCYTCDKCGLEWIVERDEPPGGTIEARQYKREDGELVGTKTFSGDLCDECAEKYKRVFLEFMGPEYAKALGIAERMRMQGTLQPDETGV